MSSNQFKTHKGKLEYIVLELQHVVEESITLPEDSNGDM